MHSEPGAVESNLERMEYFANQALSRGAEIVCFPELSVTGYMLRGAESIYHGRQCHEAIGRVVEIAKAKEIVLLAGLIEVAKSRGPYIAQVVAGPKGLMGIYRKTHLSPMEQGIFLPGEELPVFEHDGVVFGVQLCWEAHFPEISTIMALKGAEIIFMPHASPRTGPQEKLDSWLRHMTSRAFDNGVYIAACNQAEKTSEGYTFPGVAVIIDPAGWIIAQRAEEGEGITVATLRSDQLKEIRQNRMKYFLPHRRPELYRLLTKEKES